MARTKVHGEYLDPSVISAQTEVTAVGSDHMLIFDATDNALKKALLSDLIETVGSTPTFTGLTVNSSEVLFDNTSGDFTLKLNTNAVSDKNEIIMGDTGTPLAKFGVGGTANDIITGSDGQDFNIGTAGGGRAINFSTDNFASVEMKLDGGKLGIGTNPYHTFDVFGAVIANGAAKSNGLFFDTTSATTGTGGGIALGGYSNGTGGAIYHFGNIQGIKENSTAGNYASAMLFSTRANGATPTERMRIDSSGDVLIGQTSQTGYAFAQKLVVGDGDANDGITIQSGSTHQGNLAFNHSDGTTAHGRISYQHNSNYMSFFTNNVERMRITSTGGVEAGDGTNYGYLKVISDDAVTGYFDRRNGSGTILQFRLNDSTIGSLNIHSSTLQIGTGNTQLAFSDADDAFFVKNEAGANRDGSHDLGKSSARFHNLYLSGGAYLGGTGSANYLDDYEEGTWTVSLTPSVSGSITINSGINTMKYTKVGRLVTITGRVNISSISSPTGGVRFNLPFTTSNTGQTNSNYAMFLIVTHGIDTTNTTQYVMAEAGNNTTQAEWREVTDNADWPIFPATNLKTGGGQWFYINGSYTTA